MLKGIIFDLDGTLVDSLAATFDAFNHGIMKMGGKKHAPEEIIRHFGPGEGEIFARIVGRDKADEAYRLSREYMDAHLGEVPLHTGVEELLERLEVEKVPISIFTGRGWDTTEMILKHHGLMDRFVTVVANDHVNLPKPSPEGLHLALSRMKMTPEEVLFVGDSPADMIASRSAGAQGVAALWDLLAKRDLMEPYEPYHWASHPLEVWEFFKKAATP